MKRISALICVIMMVAIAIAPACFAADDAAKASSKSGFGILSTSPEDGKTGVAVDNFSVKIYFDKDVKPVNKKTKELNAKQFVLKSEDGVRIPVKVYYSDDETGLLMVAADVVGTKDKDKMIKGNVEYTLTIKPGFTAADGTSFNKKETIVLKTLDQQKSTMVYMVLMFAMMGGMVFFTVRSTKKAAESEKEKEKAKKTEAVNPYKEAKRTGKSVKEIVEADAKKKNKKSAAAAKREAELEELEARILAEIKKAKNKRVAGPRPISAAGSQYKVKVVQPVEEKKTSKGTTNPKKKGKGKKKK